MGIEIKTKGQIRDDHMQIVKRITSVKHMQNYNTDTMNTIYLTITVQGDSSALRPVLG